MNTFFKTTLLFSFFIVVISQSGCGPLYAYDDGYWVVEDEVVVADTVETTYYQKDRLQFRVTWNDDHHSGLDTSLTTPLGSIVEERGPDADGCYFLGTYNETSFQSVSLIECDDPFLGMYDLKLRNVSYVMQYPKIEVIREHRNEYSVAQQISSQDVSIAQGDIAILHFKY